MNFMVLKQAVAARFAEMVKMGRLLNTDIDRDAIWETYLNAFPPGTNPIYRKRTEYDCSCCKSFIRNIGGVVVVHKGKIETLWDIKVSEPAFQAVADALAAYTRSKAIVGPYYHYENHVGTDRNFEQVANGTPHEWQHFYVNLPKEAIKPKDQIGTIVGAANGDYQVMMRGFSEITEDAVDTVIDLISQNSLYRGEEHKAAVVKFRELQAKFKAAPNKEAFVWHTQGSESHHGTRIRNTVIGTLLVDLSNGVDLEQAVKAFEAKVAPTNYKRPTAVVTAAMIANAKKTVEELGLTSALDRRYARLTDLNINDVLFANKATKVAISGGVFDELQATKPTSTMSQIETVPVAMFVSGILPLITELEVLVENRHTPNFVSLITATDPTANQLFKWSNPFSWSYNGEVADSIKERVKAAGGRVEGDLCCRLAWNNSDDLDFHMVEPTGYEIYYGTKRRQSTCGGELDLDANGGDGHRADPAENIVYANKSRMRDGVYKLFVRQYNKRSTSNAGFEVEVEFDGQTHRFISATNPPQSTNVMIAEIVCKNGVLSIKPQMPSTVASKTVWGIATHQFHRVSSVMESPNAWGDPKIGNVHLFFMIDGVKNDGMARGFYNEFLKGELDKHRKVLELVGSKTKVKDDPNQLSGLGFAYTSKNTLTCRVKGAFTRTINILF